MKNFTLKVVHSKKLFRFCSDNQHELDGIDRLQEEAFLHLFPFGSCPEIEQELLLGLAELHGWKVSIRTRDE